MKRFKQLNARVHKWLCGSGIHEFVGIGFIDIDKFNYDSEVHQHIMLARCTYCGEYMIDPLGDGIIGDGENYEGLIKHAPPVRQERRDEQRRHAARPPRTPDRRHDQGRRITDRILETK